MLYIYFLYDILVIFFLGEISMILAHQLLPESGKPKWNGFVTLYIHLSIRICLAYFKVFFWTSNIPDYSFWWHWETHQYLDHSHDYLVCSLNLISNQPWKYDISFCKSLFIMHFMNYYTLLTLYLYLVYWSAVPFCICTVHGFDRTILFLSHLN